MIYTEYNLEDATVDKIYSTIYKYKGVDVSKETCTENGFQTSNMLDLFNQNLLKKILTWANANKQKSVIIVVFVIAIIALLN